MIGNRTCDVADCGVRVVESVECRQGMRIDNDIDLVSALEPWNFMFPFSWECNRSQLPNSFFRGVGIPPSR